MRSFIVLVVVLAAGCTEGAAGARASLGEPQDGFPSWGERVVFVWTNRARADPAADLASCTVCAERACYTPQPPVVWNHSLARAARFHSDNLALAGCSLQHDSPCTLVSDLGSRYTPGACNGAPSCACVGGSASCGSSGTSFGPRIGLFGGSARAENIATGSDPVSTFYRWLHEADSSSACGWRIANDHRANILGDARALGVGNVTIMYRHLLPNAMVATLTFLPFILSGSITTLTSLDFLGFGMPPGSPSLGELIAQGKENLQAPWLGLTAFAVMSLMLSLLIFVGEATRDAFDPRKTFR